MVKGHYETVLYLVEKKICIEIKVRPREQSVEY